MEGNNEIKVFVSFVVNEYINDLFAPFFPLLGSIQQNKMKETHYSCGKKPEFKIFLVWITANSGYSTNAVDPSNAEEPKW